MPRATLPNYSANQRCNALSRAFFTESEKTALSRQSVFLGRRLSVDKFRENIKKEVDSLRYQDKHSAPKYQFGMYPVSRAGKKTIQRQQRIYQLLKREKDLKKISRSIKKAAKGVRRAYTYKKDTHDFFYKVPRTFLKASYKTWFPLGTPKQSSWRVTQAIQGFAGTLFTPVSLALTIPAGATYIPCSILSAIHYGGTSLFGAVNFRTNPYNTKENVDKYESLFKDLIKKEKEILNDVLETPSIYVVPKKTREQVIGSLTVTYDKWVDQRKEEYVLTDKYKTAMGNQSLYFKANYWSDIGAYKGGEEDKAILPEGIRAGLSDARDM